MYIQFKYLSSSRKQLPTHFTKILQQREKHLYVYTQLPKFENTKWVIKFILFHNYSITNKNCWSLCFSTSNNLFQLKSGVCSFYRHGDYLLINVCYVWCTYFNENKINRTTYATVNNCKKYNVPQHTCYVPYIC